YFCDFVLGVKRSLDHQPGELSGEGKSNDRSAIFRGDPGLLSSGYGALDDAVGQNPKLEKAIVCCARGWRRRTLSRYQTSADFGLIPRKFLAHHLNRVLWCAAALGRSASHFHPHGGRIVTNGGVILGLERWPR